MVERANSIDQSQEECEHACGWVCGWGCPLGSVGSHTTFSPHNTTDASTTAPPNTVGAVELPPSQQDCPPRHPQQGRLPCGYPKDRQVLLPPPSPQRPGEQQAWAPCCRAHRLWSPTATTLTAFAKPLGTPSKPEVPSAHCAGHQLLHAKGAAHLWKRSGSTGRTQQPTANLANTHQTAICQDPDTQLHP